jgi:uncharacterized Fe-S cluster-containing radical SAM superfamily enzyme
MKRRCDFPECKKPLMLSSITCKCNKTFCSVHRGSYDHSCSFDYKSDHTNMLMKHMSTPVVADKLGARL